ncbi:unnamed protein product, partial [Scytosiphon promiscuus]
MYASNLRRAGTATRPGHARRVRPLGPGRAPPAQQQRGTGGATRGASNAAGDSAARTGSGESKLAGWARAGAGAVALVPVIGGAWLVTAYALRQRLCEHHLQQVEVGNPTSSRDRDRERRRRSRNASGGSGGGGGGSSRPTTTQPPLYPGSSADAKALREVLAVPASGVTVLCVDPPASYTGDAFVRSALLGRAATVHVRAGEGYGSLAACLARGLGVEFMAIKLQISALVPGLGGGERDWRSGGRGGSTSASELSDIEAVLETATAALEEIRNQATDSQHHLPPVIIIDGLLGRIRTGEEVPAAVSAVLRWCWTVTGGRRLAHVVLTAPQSMAVDGSLVRAKEYLNGGRLAPGMVRAVALNAPDSKLTERRFRSLFATAAAAPRAEDGEGGGGGDIDGERAVALCMELVHREGCAVSEEANEILRKTDVPEEDIGNLSASRLALLEETLDTFALEAWRRVAAAVASTAPPGHPDAAADVARAAAGSYTYVSHPPRSTMGMGTGLDAKGAGLLPDGSGGAGGPVDGGGTRIETGSDVYENYGGGGSGGGGGRNGINDVGSFTDQQRQQRQQRQQQHAAGSPSATPLRRLVRLLGELADG